MLMGRGTVRLITQTINDFYFVVNVQNLTIPPVHRAQGPRVGVLAAAVLSALPPALEAARTAPRTTMQRSTLESRVQKVLPWFWLAWVVLTGLGVLCSGCRGGLVVTFAGLFRRADRRPHC